MSNVFVGAFDQTILKAGYHLDEEFEHAMFSSLSVNVNRWDEEANVCMISRTLLS
jgi:hypothetical protein